MATPKRKGRGQTKARRTRRPATSASLLSQIDPATLSPAGQALLAKAIAANRPISANAIPTLGQAAKAATQPKPAAPVSPWVRRAQQGNLPQKDMTNSRGPRADTYGGIMDVAKAAPYLQQATGVELLRTVSQELHSMNRARVARGERPIDFPGNTGPGTRKTTKRKANTMPKRSNKGGATRGKDRAAQVKAMNSTKKSTMKKATAGPLVGTRAAKGRTDVKLTERRYSKGRSS